MAKKNRKPTRTASEGNEQTTSKRGPVLTWNRSRDRALVAELLGMQAEGEPITYDGLTDRLMAREEFANHLDALTAFKVANRTRRLQKVEGLDLPSVKRGPGSRYAPSAEDLADVAPAAS